MESIIQILISGNTTSGITSGMIDLYDNEPINLEYSISDVSNLTERKGTFSQAFSVPGNANNNRLFSNLFEIGIDSSFDPRKKAFASIIVDYIQIAKGYIQMVDISVSDKNDVIYQFVFYGETNNLMSKIEGKYLTDLDYTELNHTLSVNNIMKSWTGTSNPSTATTYGFYYPLIDYGYDWTINDLNGVNNSGKGIPIEQLFPATYAKYILDKIFSASNYTYSSTFLSSTTFDQLIIPFNGNSDELFPPSYRTDRLFSTDLLAPINALFNSYTNISGGTYALDFDINNISPAFVATLTPILGNYVSANPDFFSADTYTIQKFYLKTNYTVNGLTTNNFLYSNLKVTLFRSSYLGGVVPFHTESTPNQYAGTFTYIFQTPWLDNPGSSTYYPVEPGEQFTAHTQFLAQTSASPVLTQTPFSLSSMTYYNDVSLKLPASGQVIYNHYIPQKIKQTDFVNSLINMFNLYIEPDKNKINNLIIEPRDIFYSGGNTITDWVLDQEVPITEKLLSEQQNKKVTLTYKADKDYLNDNYLTSENRIYGDFIFDFDNDFIEGEKKVELIFSPTPPTNVIGSSSIIIPKIFKLDSSGNFGATDFNIRILRKNPALTKTTGGESIKFYNTTNIFAYPYCGHLDHPLTGTTDYNFSAVGWVYYTLSAITQNNLGFAYWKKYFDQISDKDSKLITCNVFLKDLNIQQFSFRDTLFLEGLTNDGGDYFNIQNIKYNPTINGSHTIELLKVKNNTYTLADPTALNTPPINPTSTARSSLSLGGGIASSPGSISIGNANYNSSRNSISIGTNSIIGASSDGSVLIGDNSKIGSSSTGATIFGANSVVGDNSFNIRVFGNNVTGNNFSRDIFVFGSDNFIPSGTTGSTIFGNGITATTSNTTFVNNLTILSGLTIISSTGTSFCSGGLKTSFLSGCSFGPLIDLNTYAQAVVIDDVNGALTSEYLFMQPGTGIFLSSTASTLVQGVGTNSNNILADGSNDQIRLYTTIGVSERDYLLAKNNVSSSTSTQNNAIPTVFIGAQNATSVSVISNSVVLGGQGVSAISANTVYVPSLVVQNNKPFYSQGSIASGSSAYAFGNSVNAYGNYSHAEGSLSSAYGDYSHAGGFDGVALNYGEWARSSNQFGAYGIVSYAIATSNATITEMFLDNSGTKRFLIENNSGYFVELSVIGVNQTSFDSIQYKGQGLIKNVGGTVSLVGTFTMTSTNGDASLAGTSITVTADNTNKSLKVQATGVLATSINWFSKAEYTRTY